MADWRQKCADPAHAPTNEYVDLARWAADAADLLDGFQDARDPDFPDPETDALLERLDTITGNAQT